MKVKVFFLFVFAITFLLLQSEAKISLEMNPEDFDQVIEFIQTIAINNHPNWITPNRKMYLIKSIIKKAALNTIQLIGVMFSLVGANVISSYYIPPPTYEFDKNVPNQTFEFNKHVPNLNNPHAEECLIDYGCNKNICWKSCNLTINETKSWCYASPDPRKMHYCVNAMDCSMCWDCLEACHV